MTGPIILCGLGHVGWRVLEYLRTAGLNVTVIDETSSTDPKDPRLVGVTYLQADFRQPRTLEKAGLRDALGVIIVTSDDLLNVNTALQARQLNPNVRIVLRMFNRNLLARLGKTLPNVYALSVSALAAPILAMTAMTGKVLGGFPIGNEARQIVEITLAPDSPWLGKRLGDFAMNGQYLVLAHWGNDEVVESSPDKPSSLAGKVMGLVGSLVRNQSRAPTVKMVLDIDPNELLSVNDHLVVCGEPERIRELIDPAYSGDDSVQFAGRIRSSWRLLRQSWSEVDLAVKFCTVALLTTISLSMIVYHFGMGVSWADGLYRTISVIATTSDMKGDQYVGGWEKIFISFLRLAGTAMVAAFTAIMTNFLIRARFGHVLEVSRIPESGHVVICGLGNVGIRVAEELQKSNQRVVIIERNADNPFILTCRHMGIPVIQGDATIDATLKQANVDAARAVVTCTSDDLVNLEVALLVSERNPDQRVVVRLSDPIMAETIRSAAGVELALAVPELAAPAFVAGLLGDEVRTMFRIGDQMILILEVKIDEDHPNLLDRSVRALAVDYGFAPMAVINENDELKPLEGFVRLHKGDRLILAATLASVEKILRREEIAKNYRVQVTSVPLTAKDELQLKLRAIRNFSVEEANQLMSEVPFDLAVGITYGEAEELLALLARERVHAEVKEI
jgi:Trk K+ transport system NAD-binding subunit